MSVYTIDPLQDDRWPELIARHPKASVFHTRGWLRALQTTYGYEPVAFTTSPASQELTNAVLFCVVRSWLTGDRLVSLPFSDHCEPLVDDIGEFGTICVYAESLRKHERWRYVEIRSSDSLLDYRNGFSEAKTYCLHQLDLRPSLDTLQKGFSKKGVQHRIGRAVRESLSYEVGRSESLIQQLFALLKLTRARHRIPPQPIEWFRNLATCMGDDMCIRIASKAGRPVAGILTLRHGKKIVYKYSGSDTRYNNFGGTPMLLWHVIREAKAIGAEGFDFGRSDIDNSGLIAFKEHWSAASSTLTTWRCPAATASSSFDQVKGWLAKEGFARLPNSALTLAGRLLYRHIG